MNWLSVLMFSLLVNGVAFQAADTQKWNTVELTCGKLVHVEVIPLKGVANSFTEKLTPIKKATLRLYRRNDDTPCCEGQQTVAETTSSRDGGFEFKKAVPGDYWVVANIEGKDYKLAINYTPENKGDAKCSDILYELKRDDLQLARMILVE